MYKTLKNIAGFILVLGAIAFIGWGVLGLYNSNKQVGNIATTPIIYSGMTNSTTSIARANVTTVFTGSGTGSFSIYARISNPSNNSISCYAESATAASSTLTLNNGISFGSLFTSTSTEGSICFGATAGCIPYVGQVNCIASQTSTVGITYK